MFNIVYAFDENYNQQAYVSICSFMENVSEECHVFIVHRDGASFNKYELKLVKMFSNLRLTVKTFTNEGYYFPNLDSAHVSEATYYRLFFDKYIPQEIHKFLYIDADVICMNDPSMTINNVFSAMTENGNEIAAREEAPSNTNDLARRKAIGVNSKYFNAGVLFINYEVLQQKNTFPILRKRIKEIESEIIFWDQDVLNSYYDGNFLNIDSTLNFNPNNLSDKSSHNDISDILFLHYQGSNKPWNIDGIFSSYSSQYHNIYRKYGLGDYHITSSWRTDTLKKFLSSLFTLRFFKLTHPLKYITSVIFFLISKKEN